MDYQDYAADISPHLSSSSSSCPSSSAVQASYIPLAMNSPSPDNSAMQDSTALTFPQQCSVSPCPTSSANTQLALYDSSHNNGDTSRSLQLVRQGVTVPEYWQTHTPLLLNNPTPKPDVEVNHSERGIAGFVSKLYQSLQAPDDGQKYARWCKHDGKDMFVIECIPKFTEVVLPRLFKHCKFASFVRQLNIYGFQRDTDARKTKDTKDKESCRWHHPHFRPGRRDLFHLIRRKTTRSSRPKRRKMNEDPETIVNVGSGDESDNDFDRDNRRSSSVSSSVHQENHSSGQQQQQQQPFGVIYNKNMQEQPRQVEEPLVPPAAAATPSDAESYTVQEGREGSGMVVEWRPYQPSSSYPPPQQQQDQDLRAQVIQLTQAYQRMTKTYAAQIKGAYDLIEAQNRRIYALEVAHAKSQMVAYHQQQQQQRPCMMDEMYTYHHQQPRPKHEYPPPLASMQDQGFHCMPGSNYGLLFETNGETVMKMEQPQQPPWLPMFPDSSTTPSSSTTTGDTTPGRVFYRATNTSSSVSSAANNIVSVAAATAASNTTNNEPIPDLTFGLGGTSKYARRV